MELLTAIVGYAAAVFGTALMMPQVYKSIKTKRVDDISMVMLIVYVVNCSLWGAYGILLNAMPVILCNSAALAIGIFQTILKVKYQSKQNLSK
jgi:MtN3 and saliva related transmembrane protein